MSHGPIVAVEGGGMEDSWMAENAEEDKFAPSSGVKKEEEGGSILNRQGRKSTIAGLLKEENDDENQVEEDADSGNHEPQVSAEAEAAFAAWSSGGAVQSCATCSEEFESSAELRTHMVMHHHEDIASSFGGAHGDTYIECLLCHSWLVHDRIMVQSHFKKEHRGVTLKEYFVRHVYNRAVDDAVVRKNLTFRRGCATVAGKKVEMRLSLRKSNVPESSPLVTSTGEFQRWRYRKDESRLFTWKKFLKDAPVTKVLGNKCVFKCYSCNNEFKTSPCFKAHHKYNRYKCDTKPPRQHLSAYVTKKVAFVCTICKEKLLCDTNHVTSHMRSSHGMSAKGYHVHTAGEWAKIPERQQKCLPVVKELHDFLKGGPFSQEVENRCIFQCPNCSQKFSAWESILRHHARANASCKGIGQERDIKKLTVKKVVHACNICGDFALCDRNKIAVHLNNRHKILLKDYIEYCSKRSQQSLTETLNHQREQENRELAERKLSLNSVPKVPTHLFAKNMSVLPHQIPKEKTTFKVEDLCLFSCPKCSRKDSSWLRISTHALRKCVGSSKLESIDIVEARVHMCYICSMRLLCDVNIIMTHAKSAHQMDFKMYKELIPSASDPEKSGYFGIEKECHEKAERRNSVPVVKTPFKTPSVRPEKLSREYTTRLVENLCIFKCPACPYESESFDPLRTHLRKGCVKPEDPGFQGFHYSSVYVREARYHRCGLCSHRIICDRSFISTHVNGIHKMTISEYEKYIKEHGEKPGLEEVDEEARKVAELRTDIKATTPFPKVMVKASLVPASSLTLGVADLCTFTCGVCQDHRTHAWCNLTHHYKRHHKGIAMSRFNPRYVSVAKYHKCRMPGCPTAVLCTRQFIAMHVTSVHKMDLKTYCDLGRKGRRQAAEETEED